MSPLPQSAHDLLDSADLDGQRPFLRVAAAANPRAVLWQDEFGQWQPISSDQIYQRVRALATAFLRLGAKKGDRIALISENRWEWAVTDFATLAIGAADVPIYPTLTGEQIAELVRDAGCRIAVVSTRQQFDKLHSVRAQTNLEAHRHDGLAGSRRRHRHERAASPMPMRAALSAIPSSTRSSAPSSPHDLATLIYTSGTTGEPKGVALTHGNIAANQNVAAVDFDFDSTDACISFLPLSHVTARALDYVMYNYGAQVAYCSQFDKLPQAMREVRPTVIVGVPRVFEKIRQAVERKAGAVARQEAHSRLGHPRGFALRRYRLRRPPAQLAVSGSWPTSSSTPRFARPSAAACDIFVSGGAPLGIDTARWFASVGIALWEGYGLTETSPVIALNTPIRHRMGAAGMPLPQCRAEARRRRRTAGPRPIGLSPATGNKPAATAECFDSEGWFRTGDIGHLDADGFLYITDRKKELLKTSGGKLVAPQPIENKLKNSVLVAQAALVGDRHKFISALISPNFAALEEWAAQHGIHRESRAELVADPRVVALYAEIVREVNGSLANFETLKRFRIVADEWTQDSGELTPSMKIKRRVLTARYAAVIDELYADEATARGESAS